MDTPTLPGCWPLCQVLANIACLLLGIISRPLIKAMKQWGKRNIAISIRQNAPNIIIERKADLLKKLPYANLSFFKAETHPLGNLNGENSL